MMVQGFGTIWVPRTACEQAFNWAAYSRQLGVRVGYSPHTVTAG